MKLCECGCGKPVRQKPVRGNLIRFVWGHNMRNQPKGESHHRWKGGESVSSNGRPMLWMPDHPRSHSNGKGGTGSVYEHIIIAEKALGKFLPEKAHVHHADTNIKNNSNNNLVICEDRVYHGLLHRRTRAYQASGNPHWCRCIYCKKYDNPENMYTNKKNNMSQHRECANKYQNKRRAKNGV